MSVADANERALDRVGGQRRPRQAAQQTYELGERERPLEPRAGFDHRSHDMVALEPEHEVERLELGAPEGARRVAGEVEPQFLRERNGLGQSRLAAEVERPERDDPHRHAVRLPCEQRGREGAAEPVSGADERDLQLSHEAPIRSSIRTCRARTSGPVSRGARRITRDFQTSAGSLGASAAASL